MSFQISIDKNIVNVHSNMSILQACESVNLVIPRFCYHERLSVAGNCRMCLIEIDKAPKLVASCAMLVAPNMIVHTNSLIVKKAREGVLEFLLVNHPLDCAICDQAGECDLQDQTMLFGSDRSRFQEYKRAVEDLECGPLIKTVMTRCIHCTRCVRFANEIIGVTDLGTSGRGNSLEINLYIKKLLKSEFSGNLIDLCPVGALTSKPYTFVARPWELKSIESIDVLDAVGSNTRIDTRGYEIVRILPRLNEKINEEWISDKTRFAFDGLKRQRLYEPLIKQNEKFVIISWQDALQYVASHFGDTDKPYKINGVIGPQADLESIVLLKHLIAKKQGLFLNFEKPPINCIDFQSTYVFNSTIASVEKTDLCILLGVNPRIEGAIVNLRLRKKYMSGHFKVASFGSALNLSFPIYNFGSSLSTLMSFIEGKHKFCEHFTKAQKPTIIVGKSFFQTLGEGKGRLIVECLHRNSRMTQHSWNGMNILNCHASDCGTFECGVQTKLAGDVDTKLLYCIGESYFNRLSSSTFIVYQGHQGSNPILEADLILPSFAFTEKSSTFVNIEGRYQQTKAALIGPGNAKEDWVILQALKEKLDSSQIRKSGIFFSKKEMSKSFRFKVGSEDFKNVQFAAKDFLIRSKIVFKNSFIPSAKLENFYLGNVINDSSVIMAKCSKVLIEKLPFLK